MDAPQHDPHEAYRFHLNWTQPPPIHPEDSDLPLRIHAEEMKRVYSLMDRLRSSSAIRKIADDFMGRHGSRLLSMSPVIEPLIRPSRFHWRERQVAVWIMGRAQLAPQQREFAIETLIQVMQGKLEMEPGEKLRRNALRTLPFSFFGAGFLSSGFPADSVPFPAIMAGLFCSILPFMMIVSGVLDEKQWQRLQAETVNALGNLEAPESLAVVVGALQSGPLFQGKGRRRIQQAAAEALPRILPHLTDQHYAQIPSETMQGLCRLLNTGEETLAVCILKAFEHIGDRTALLHVEKLASGGGRAGREVMVHQAARACLPILQARVNRENDPHTLLRGAAMPQTPADMLLRPLDSFAPTDPMELLRASAEPDWKGTEQDIQMVIQVLNQLQAQGNSLALPYIEAILEAPSVDPRILSAAQACLPVLRAHVELEQYSPQPPNFLELRSNA